MEDCQTLENSEEGRVGGPKIQGKEKTRELRLSAPLTAFTSGLFEIVQPKSNPYYLARVQLRFSPGNLHGVPRAHTNWKFLT